MTKPIVFNYHDHEIALERIRELEAEVQRLKDDKANLEIKCRILEADNEHTKGQIPE